MKKIILMTALSLVMLTSCGEQPQNQPADTPSENTGERMTLYDKDGVTFDIPSSWQSNFKAVTREVGSSGNTYPQTDFYYTKNGRDIRVMSIGKFSREQWDNLKKTEQGAEDALLGESEDKKSVYSLFYENHDYINDKELKGVLDEIKTDAEKIRENIMVK